MISPEDRKVGIAGDVGGTKTLLSWVETVEGQPRHHVTREYWSRDYRSLEEPLAEFFRETGFQALDSTACFGVAGPVARRRCKTLNLPWVVDGETLERKFGFRRVEIVNDFEAIIQGLPQLKPVDLAVLNRGTPSDNLQTIAVLGAGTGLGEAGAFYDPDQKRYRVIPSEGGHCDFSPTNEEEVHLLRFLRGRYGHVSFERVLSGPGLVNLFDYLAESGSFSGAEAIRIQMTRDDPAAVITRNALEKGDKFCVRVLDLFTSIYGTEAGNLALKFLARGGVYLGGGIAPKILKKMRDGTFMGAFVRKGRYQPLMEGIPVSIILNPLVGLLGAGEIALRL